jgi:two-component system NtrC family sensor kinase
VNLLVNAAHSISESGNITCTTWSDNRTANVSIADTGCGIAPEHLTRIFEPFFTTKEMGKGTGLGLSISYDIIKKHQGDIAVESKVGSGTTFTISLPLESSEPNQTFSS